MSLAPPVIDAAMDGLTAPLLALGKPDARVYLPFLLGAAVLAGGVWFRRVRVGRRAGEGGPARARPTLLGFLFPSAIWLHRSALLDYRFLFARSLVRVLLFGPLLFSSVAVAVGVSAGLGRALGPAAAPALGPHGVMVAFTLVAFVAEDLARYLTHRLAHRVPFLWELHKLHHSAEVMTPFTVYRAHPIEGLLMRSGAVFAVGLVAGIFRWLFPGQVSGAMILGVDAMGFLWNLLGANLRHSHVWLSYGRLLEHVFISPAQHQIHHSDQRRHHHKNLGSTLAVWDWLGGSLYVTRGREPVRFGLPVGEKNHVDTVASALFAPLWAACRRALGARVVAAAERPRSP